MLNYVISAGSYGNEYPLGLLGDIYLQRGDKKKALEMYKKSGTIDSLKKAKKLE
jgi:predicted negative regulator of RcsB-dependent stress response